MPPKLSANARTIFEPRPGRPTASALPLSVTQQLAKDERREIYADGAAAFVEGVARGIGYELRYDEPYAPAVLRTHPERMIHEDQFDALIIEF